MAAGIDRSNLIYAAQTGDPAAIGQLLTVCQADARRYAYRHCQVSDVDDAVQEALLTISRKLDGLKAVAAFSAWLFTVVRRECHKLARMMLRHDPLDESIAEQQLVCRSDEALRADLSAPWNRFLRTTSKSYCCATSRSSPLPRSPNALASSPEPLRAGCTGRENWCANTCWGQARLRADRPAALRFYRSAPDRRPFREVWTRASSQTILPPIS